MFFCYTLFAIHINLQFYEKQAVKSFNKICKTNNIPSSLYGQIKHQEIYTKNSTNGKDFISQFSSDTCVLDLTGIN